MILLDPKNLSRPYPEERSAEIMRKTVGFFESKGKARLLADYARLILENAKIYGIEDDLLDQIFEFMVGDVARHGLGLLTQPSSNDEQTARCREMICKSVHDAERYERVWSRHIEPLDGAYAMNP